MISAKMTAETLAEERVSSSQLKLLDSSVGHTFSPPNKKIHDGPDLSFFLTSLAYKDIMLFMMQLNRSMVPRKVVDDEGQKYRIWDIDSEYVQFSPPVQKLRDLIMKLENLITEAPPDTGPRRFGNVSFRKWYKLAEDRIAMLLEEHVSPHVLHFGSSTSQASDKNPVEELQAYLLGSFGSPQRLDYGTGHELSFLAFLGCIWKLNGFAEAEQGVEERGIVLGIFQPYLDLVRQIIKTYTLEPAGSHGVWGLDDNSFLPYVFGSAQLSQAISETDETPVYGSIEGAPDLSSVTQAKVVEEERTRNMYFSAVGFIYDVKRGPFWEHSPMLFDISGIKDGWGKINKGMIKMYNAEVLSKFPVVQHFPFGSLFRWEKDPNAPPAQPTSHTTSQPLRNPDDMNQPFTTRPTNNTSKAIPQTSAATPWAAGSVPPPLMPGTGTAAPWATAPSSKPPVGMVGGVTRAPWAGRTPAPPPSIALNSRARGPPPRTETKGGFSTTASVNASSEQGPVKTPPEAETERSGTA